MTTTQHDLQRAAILTACRSSGVAASAGVSAVAWASTTNPRVQSRNSGGYIAGLHRGRLPAIEVWQESAQWDRQTPDGGTISTQWTIRVHVPGPTWEAAHAAAHAILQTALIVLRATQYLDEGDESTMPLEASPLGFSMDATVSLVHAFGRDTYETNATFPVEDTLGGNTLLLTFAGASPQTVLVLPSDQALDNIECHVLEAWDGVGASIRIGTTAQPGKYFDTGAVDLTTVGTTEADFDTLGAETIIATMVPGTGASTGRARIQITTTRKGT